MPTVYFSEGKWNKQGIGEKIYIPEVTEPLLDCFNGEQFKSLAFKMFMTKSVEKPVALELPEGVVADAPTKKKYDKRGALFRMNQYCNLLADLKVRFGQNASAMDKWFIKEMGYKGSTALFLKRAIEEGYIEERPFAKASWTLYPIMFTQKGWEKFVLPLKQAA